MRKTIRKILIITGWALLGVFLAVTLAFSTMATSDLSCSRIVINYAGNQMITLPEKDLIKLVKLADPSIIGKKMEKIDTEAIEARVLKNEAIARADAYKVIVRDSTGFKGVVTLKVRHRIPALRVLSSQGNYYLDKEGNRIPVNINYAANVPVATGNITPKIAREEILPVVEFIQENKFWRSQIKQIHVNNGGELIFTTLVGNQLIEFGNSENKEEKFRNLRAFYEQVLAENNWDKYNRINVKFKNQVIAKKSK